MESTLADWKTKIDKFLCQILDLPVTTDQVAGLCDSLTAAPTNSIIHWIPHLGLRDRRGKKDMDHRHLSPCVEPEDLVETERVQMENERDCDGLGGYKESEHVLGFLVDMTGSEQDHLLL